MCCAFVGGVGGTSVTKIAKNRTIIADNINITVFIIIRNFLMCCKLFALTLCETKLDFSFIARVGTTVPIPTPKHIPTELIAIAVPTSFSGNQRVANTEGVDKSNIELTPLNICPGITNANRLLLTRETVEHRSDSDKLAVAQITTFLNPNFSRCIIHNTGRSTTRGETLCVRVAQSTSA